MILCVIYYGLSSIMIGWRSVKQILAQVKKQLFIGKNKSFFPWDPYSPLNSFVPRCARDKSSSSCCMDPAGKMTLFLPVKNSHFFFFLDKLGLFLKTWFVISIYTRGCLTTKSVFLVETINEL